MALMLLAVAVLAAPLLVPLPSTTLRFVVSLMAIMVGVKIYDLHRAVETGPRPRGGEFLKYLFNDCSLVFRRGERQHRLPRRADAFRLLWLIPIATVCVFAVFAIWRLEWQAYPWILEHCVKVVAIAAFVQFGLNIGASARRLAGIPALDFSGWFFIAHTPAEFWRRWNKPAGQLIHDYIFLPAGGSRRAFVAIMTAFAVNGLVHEYVFGIAAGRVLGMAFPFFVIQGLATAATMRLRLSGPEKVLGILLTVIFNLTTSWLLFACVDAVIPFYAVRQN